MKVEELISVTTKKLKDVRVESDRIPMQNYMKGKFEFFGVKSPARKIVQQELKQYWKPMNLSSIISYARILWDQPQRELQYVAMAALEMKSKKMNPTYLPHIEELITTKSWWDTVDMLASNVVGTIIYQYPDTKLEWIDRWNSSANIWLQRTVIIHQLKYKNDVDLELLFATVESHIGSDEFFINKASGWALRQASKFYPIEVKNFIDHHADLSNLTIREGSKYL